jgi:hypothetical protein
VRTHLRRGWAFKNCPTLIDSYLPYTSNEWDPIPVPARMFKSQYQTNIGQNTFSQGFSLQKFHKIAKHQKYKYNNNFTKKNKKNNNNNCYYLRSPWPNIEVSRVANHGAS